jgi:pilus assembly protein CpaE
VSNRLDSEEFDRRGLHFDAGPADDSGDSATPRTGRALISLNEAAQPARRYSALLVSGDNNLAGSLLAHFAAKSRIELRTFAGPLSQLEERTPAIKPPDAVIIDLTGGNPTDVHILERLKRTTLANVSVIAISNPSDQAIVRGLMQAKVDDWFPSGVSPEEVYASCENAIRSHQSGGQDWDAKCISFFPAHGGCGNTALAIQAAFLIGGRKDELSSTCLIDLNFHDGSVADYLDLTPAFEVSEIGNMKRRLDKHLLDVMITRHQSGLAVLAAPRTPGRCADVEEGIVASILGLLSESFDHLIIDLPKTWFPWTDNVLWGSDRIFVVSGFTVPGLRHARGLADTVSSKAGSRAEVSVIVNKFYEPLFGAGLSRNDAATILENRLAGFVPDLGRLVDEAVNQGVPLSELRTGNKFEKSLRKILGGGSRTSKSKQ